MPLLEHLLPDFIVADYQLTRVEESSDRLHVYLQEKNDDESAISRQNLLSKGFLPEIPIQDFPIRHQRVFLHLKRRRWLNTKTGQTHQRDCSEVAQGTRMTKEFAAFLKEINGFIPPPYQ